MAILADTYKSLSKETDIGIKTFTQEFQNRVYTISDDFMENFLGFNLSQLPNLNTLTGQLSGILNDIVNLPMKIVSDLQNALNNVINGLLGMPYVGYSLDLLNNLKDIDEQGLKTYIAASTQVGSFSMCGNLDVIKGMINGYQIPQPIIEGMFLTVTLDWMNRVCKPTTPEQERNMNNYQRLETTNPYRGIEYNHENLVDTFIGTSSAYLNNLPSNYTGRTASYTEKDEIIKRGSSNDYKSYVDELRTVVTPSIKRDVMDVLDEEIVRKEKTKEIDEGYYNLLNSRGLTGTLPSHNRTMVMKASNLGRSQDALGSFLKGLGERDLTKVHPHMLKNKTKEDILIKLFSVKGLTTTVDYLARSHGYRQFEGYRFDEVFEIFTPEEIEFIKASPAHQDSHKWNGLNTTTETFIKPNIKNNKKHSPIDSQIAKPSSGKQKPTPPEYIIA